MSRASTKTDLLADNAKAFAALEEWLAGCSTAQLMEPGTLGTWSAKDTLAHLHEWHRMVLNWYAAGLRGENPQTPAEGYKWSQLPELNQRIYERYRDLPLEDVLGLFRASHRETQDLITGLSEHDLFTRGLYPWMRENTLAAYFTSNGSSHYNWALKELRKGIKKQAQAGQPH